MRPNTSELLPFGEYDKVIVSFSGGKDSTAALLHLLELGVPKKQIELWHQAVDGEYGNATRFMDWPVTEQYCRAVADALDVRIRFQWREGGFLGEMLRDATATGRVGFEVGRYRPPQFVGGKGPKGTRRKFPQMGAMTSGRWCSPYLKIDVARRAFSNDPSVKQGKFLFVTGERREESPHRAELAEIEKHASTIAGRRVDQWRVILDWPETRVWEIMKRHRVRPHPAYELGWSRVSCALCIFGDKDQWASARELLPEQFERVAEYEKEFGVTIKRGESVVEQADKGTSFLPDDPAVRARAVAESYDELNVILPADEEWKLPSGAYKRGGGPT